jgi:hypothetical protein
MGLTTSGAHRPRGAPATSDAYKEVQEALLEGLRQIEEGLPALNEEVLHRAVPCSPRAHVCGHMLASLTLPPKSRRARRYWTYERNYCQSMLPLWADLRPCLPSRAARRQRRHLQPGSKGAPTTSSSSLCARWRSWTYPLKKQQRRLPGQVAEPPSRPVGRPREPGRRPEKRALARRRHRNPRLGRPARSSGRQRLRGFAEASCFPSQPRRRPALRRGGPGQQKVRGGRPAKCSRRRLSLTWWLSAHRAPGKRRLWSRSGRQTAQRFGCHSSGSCGMEADPPEADPPLCTVVVKTAETALRQHLK